MAFLKKDREKAGHKLIGVVVSPWTHEYMTLYTLAKGTTKSKFFKSLVEDWVLKTRSEENDSTLLQEIVEQLNNQRGEDKNKMIPFGEYKKLVENELSSKGLKQTYITFVLSELKP